MDRKQKNMEFMLWLLVISTAILCRTCLETVPICESQNETNQLCCPQPEPPLHCPYNYQLVNRSVTCEQMNDTDTVVTISPSLKTTTKLPTTTITPDVPTNDTSNTTDLLAALPDSDNKKSAKVQVCEKCAKNDHFNNETMKCEKCDRKCLSCDREEKSNCTVCFIEHDGTCLAECPSGTVRSNERTENGSWLCDEEKDKIFIVIISASVGGAVVLVVIVIIIICCCWHRRKAALNPGSDRRAMSIILEGSDNTSHAPETEKSKKPRRKNYENMNTTLPGIEDITQQAESLGRYTRDPTIDRRKGASKEQDFDPYANHMMVRIAQGTDITTVDSRRLEAMVEKEELKGLGEAPRAPGIPVPTTVKQSKPSLVKRLSQRIAKTKKGKSKESPQGVTELEDYVDMSQEQPVPNQEDGLEDYENVKFSDVKKGRKAKPPAELVIAQQQGRMEMYEGEAEGAVSDLDDYENTQHLHKTGNVVPATSRNAEDDMEDYENTKDLHVTGNVEPGTDGSAEDDMEDYENMKNLEIYQNVNFDQAKGRKARK